MRALLPNRFAASLAASVIGMALLLSASPSLAQDGAQDSGTPKAESPSSPEFKWEGSKAEDVTAKSLDVLIVRPLASARVLVGAAMLIPAAILSSPSGREGFDGAYDVLLSEPMEYAFDRELGEF